MNEILCRQLALDYCCSEEDVLDHANHFTEQRFLPGRRRFREDPDCFLKIAVVNSKLLFTGQEEMIGWCRERYAGLGSEWFLEARTLRQLNDRLHQSGFQIEMMHPFFLPKESVQADTKGFEIRWYQEKEIEQFRGDERFPEALSFCPEAPDVIAAAAVRGGAIVGMAGASADSALMWQIGINVDSKEERSGVAKMLVTLLRYEIEKKGILPFYGTALSHFASQRVALGSGFVPVWAELTTSRIPPKDE